MNELLTPEELTELDRLLTELRSNGYVDIAEHGKLRPGMRIRHRGQRWPDAVLYGTGAVLALTERPDSPWSDSWHMADIELIALWDKPWPLEESSRLSQLAQYHVGVIDTGRAVLDAHGGERDG